MSVSRDVIVRCCFGALLFATIFVGCNGRGSISKLSFDASRVANAALVQYDSNHDGALAGDELAACPAVKGALVSFDKNNDGRVDGEELRNRFQMWLDSPTRLIMVACVIELDGRPLNNAKVEFVPETFLADALLPGQGTTGEDGLTGISVASSDAQTAGLGNAKGVRLGLYRVRITHPTLPIPAKYNANTTLGVEVSPASSGSPVRFTLRSR